MSLMIIELIIAGMTFLFNATMTLLLNYDIPTSSIDSFPSKCYSIPIFEFTQEPVFSMQQILKIVQIILAILLTAAILMQAQGAGLSGAFGGSGGFYRTKRGMEKIIFRATIVLAAAIGAIALVNVLI